MKRQFKILFSLLELHFLIEEAIFEGTPLNHSKWLGQIIANKEQVKKLWKVNRMLTISLYNKIRADYNKEDINKHFILGED